MSPLIIYFIAVALLIIFSVVISLYFVRYRFKGDLTWVFIFLFAVAFVAIIILTMSFYFATPVVEAPEPFF
jgi:hypothetical protein